MLCYVMLYQLFFGNRDARVTNVKTVPRCSYNNDIRLGLFNGRSVRHKSPAMNQRDEAQPRLRCGMTVRQAHSK